MRRIELLVSIEVDDADPAFANAHPINEPKRQQEIEIVTIRDVHAQICDIGYTGQVIVVIDQRAVK